MFFVLGGWVGGRLHEHVDEGLGLGLWGGV